MNNYLTSEQYAILMHPRGIHKDRVLARDGMAYVEAHDIKAEMIRVYGFDRFSWRLDDVTQLFERSFTTKKGTDAWHVGYRVHGVLSVHASDGTWLADYSGAHAGASIHPDLGEAHGNALTNADSYAFKRAALFPLGTQGGLGLYNKGAREEIIRWTAVKPEGAAGVPANADDAVPIAAESLVADPPVEPRETNTPTPEPKRDDGPLVAAGIRDRALAPPPDGATPAKHLMHLTAEAIKAGVLQERVENQRGVMVALKVLLDECLKAVGRQQGNPAADRAAAS